MSKQVEMNSTRQITRSFNEKVIQQGYLKKRSKQLKKVNIRFVMLTSDELITYQEFNDSKEPTGVFNIESMNSIENISNHNYSFRIFMKNDVLIFESDSNQINLDWIHNIRSLIDNKREHCIYSTLFHNLTTPTYQYYNYNSRVIGNIFDSKQYGNNTKLTKSPKKDSNYDRISNESIEKVNQSKEQKSKNLNHNKMSPNIRFESIGMQNQTPTRTDNAEKEINDLIQTHVNILNKSELREEIETEFNNSLSLNSSKSNKEQIDNSQIFDKDSQFQSKYNQSTQDSLNITSIKDIVKINIGLNVADYLNKSNKASSNPVSQRLEKVKNDALQREYNVSTLTQNEVEKSTMKLIDTSKVNSSFEMSLLGREQLNMSCNRHELSMHIIREDINECRETGFNLNLPNATNNEEDFNRNYLAQINLSYTERPVEGSFFNDNYSKQTEAKNILYQKSQTQSKSLIETFEWNEATLHSRNVFNDYIESSQIKPNYLDDKCIQFIDALFKDDDQMYTSDSESIISPNKQKTSRSIRAYYQKELFSSHFSQYVLNIIIKLLDKYPDIIFKITHVSLSISNEDLHELSKLFNAKAPHVFEIKDLIAFQSIHDLDLDHYRTSEKFILEIIQKIQPEEQNEVGKLEQIDSRFKTWIYFNQFPTSIQNVTTMHQQFMQILSILKSPAIADILRLTLFQGNLINSMDNDPKELSSFQLDSILKLIKYKNHTDIQFFDLILDQLPNHIRQIEEIKVQTFCQFFNDSNSAIRDFLSLIYDIVNEFDMNLGMMEFIQRNDREYRALYDLEINSEVKDTIRESRKWASEVEQQVYDIYMWFGYSPEQEEVHMMDPIFRLSFIFISHLQGLIRVRKENNTHYASDQRRVYDKDYQTNDHDLHINMNVNITKEIEMENNLNLNSNTLIDSPVVNEQNDICIRNKNKVIDQEEIEQNNVKENEINEIEESETFSGNKSEKKVESNESHNAEDSQISTQGNKNC